ncbi:hypothetical protein H072_3703 [Dactylellina haptotyla CBS 200.50]|uniref:Cytidyltransferase-like domain-containing protein n=1 Tax=Dactylellina haptotyla (strain CBS 200.50) TaxID=1284197 RepID=S8AH32_DACHA|nr:hypothetical protein H072_3703 [Dactylellina haptotyla CBS 200.50]
MDRVASIRRLLPGFRDLLSSLAETSTRRRFTLVKSFASRDQESAVTSAKRRTVCILDSSFNPPTKAHMYLAIQALQKYTPKSPNEEDPAEDPPSLLLLLATSNADKAPAPAAYEHRIAMMSLLADEIRDVYAQETSTTDVPRIDIGITRHARFIDKSEDLYTNYLYPRAQTRQIWIMGYDTLIRLLDTKYYPPEHTLTPVYDTLLSGRNRILVFGRPGDEFGSDELQREYSENVDSRVSERLDMVLADDDKTAGISSTKVRKGIMDTISNAYDVYDWRGAVCASIAEYVIDEPVYHQPRR